MSSYWFNFGKWEGFSLPAPDTLVQYHLNCQVLTNNDSIESLAHILFDMHPKSYQFKKMLFSYIYYSKKSENVSIGASNAVTILNASGFNFSQMNLQQTKLPFCNLSYAILWRTDLSGANLDRASFHGTFLNGANLSHSLMSHTKFGETPFIKDQHEGHRISLAITPDMKFLAFGNNEGVITLWNLETGEKDHIFTDHTFAVNALCVCSNISYFRGNQFLISGGSDRVLRIWDLPKGHLNLRLEGHTDQITCIAMSFDAQVIISGSWDKTLRVWNVKSGMSLFVLEGHTDWINCVVTFPEKYIAASGSNDSKVLIWDILAGTILYTINTPLTSIVSLAVNLQDESLICAESDGIIQIWEKGSHSQYRCGIEFEKDIDGVACIVYLAKWRCLVSSCSSGGLKVWDILSGKIISVIEGHSELVEDICCMNDGDFIISGGHDATIRFWNFSGAHRSPNSAYHKSDITGLTVTPDGKYLISSSCDATLKIWNAETGRHFMTCEGDSQCVMCVTHSIDPKYAFSGTLDGTIKMWNVQIGHNEWSTKDHSNSIECISTTMDGKFLLTGGDSDVINLWDINSKSHLMNMRGHSDRISCIAVSSDSKIIVSGSNDLTIRVWNMEGIEQYSREHEFGVTCVIVTPDNRFIVSGDWGGTIKVWNIVTGEQTDEIQDDTFNLTNILITNNCKSIVVSSGPKCKDSVSSTVIPYRRSSRCKRSKNVRNANPRYSLHDTYSRQKTYNSILWKISRKMEDFK